MDRQTEANSRIKEAGSVTVHWRTRRELRDKTKLTASHRLYRAVLGVKVSKNPNRFADQGVGGEGRLGCVWEGVGGGREADQIMTRNGGETIMIQRGERARKEREQASHKLVNPR